MASVLVILAVAVGLYGVFSERKIWRRRCAEAFSNGVEDGRSEMLRVVKTADTKRALSSLNGVTIAAEMVGGPMDGVRGAVGKDRDYTWVNMPNGEVELYLFQARTTSDGFWVYAHQPQGRKFNEQKT